MPEPQKRIYIRLKPTKKPDPRSNAKHKNFNLREIALQGLFQMEVAHVPSEEIIKLEWVHSNLNDEERKFIEDLILGTAELEIEIEKILQKYSKRNLETLSSIVRCVLKLGTYELLKGEFPGSIIIDSYCRLTRKYDDDHAVKYTNAILDKIYKFILQKQQEN
ncbi:MAG: hypothetical protein NZ853_07875 [Leptospiraceae bacterium]|nr:hypothetical protein [Leptospiraceae bacterium]MDW7976910.1 transcription antitermination factor NusB [Leptospiraceae bacterium]